MNLVNTLVLRIVYVLDALFLFYFSLQVSLPSSNIHKYNRTAIYFKLSSISYPANYHGGTKKVFLFR